MESRSKNVIYRARLIENPTDGPHKNISDISYIPEKDKHKIKRGRANKAGESMFYGALNYITSCAETVTHKADFFRNNGFATFTVGKWSFESPLLFAEMPHSEKHIKLFYDSTDYKSQVIRIERIQELNKKLSQKYDGIDYEVLQFFAGEFAKFDTENDYEYMLSNYYADRIFDRIPAFQLAEEIHGIMYPSIALSYENRNLVLKPEVVNKNLKFDSAMHVKMSPNNTGGTDFIPLQYNVRADDSGKLLWGTGMKTREF